jgi:hypothetical protein
MESLELLKNDWEVCSYNSSNHYYKGDINNLNDIEIWNKGDIDFINISYIKLYDENGNFYKSEQVRKIKTENADLKVKRGCIEYTIIQYNYDFFLIPVTERHTTKSGRDKTERHLIAFGIKGFPKYQQKPYREFNHYSYNRTKYEVDRPFEFCYYDVYRFNTKSFMEFSSKKYLQNYNNALKKYPEWKKELIYLKETNLNIIADFYGMERTVLEKDNFNRLTYSIKALNKKINNKIKNQ